MTSIEATKKQLVDELERNKLLPRYSARDRDGEGSNLRASDGLLRSALLVSALPFSLGARSWLERTGYQTQSSSLAQVHPSSVNVQVSPTDTSLISHKSLTCR